MRTHAPGAARRLRLAYAELGGTRNGGRDRYLVRLWRFPDRIPLQDSRCKCATQRDKCPAAKSARQRLTRLIYHHVSVRVRIGKKNNLIVDSHKRAGDRVDILWLEKRLRHFLHA